MARTSAATLHAPAAVSTAVTAIMDSSSVLIEEQKLQTEPKYRAYMANIDKALKNFEYSSEWADLISALGKLNKVSLLWCTHHWITKPMYRAHKNGLVGGYVVGFFLARCSHCTVCLFMWKMQKALAR